MERCAKMCGIAGYKFIEKDENLFQNNINQILNSLKNRGPDFQDYWHNQKKNCFLLNTRLKIQDLNNRANMPMLSVCKKFVITYNGELYNKKFLIEKGSGNNTIVSGSSPTLPTIFSQDLGPSSGLGNSS